MSEKCLQMLKQGIRDYIQWMTSAGYSPKTCQNYMSELSKFLLFICQEDTAWDEVFTLHTLKAFQQESNVKSVHAVRGLSRFLFQQKKIRQPIKRRSYLLPPIYEDYIFYFEKSREVTYSKVVSVRRILSAFNDFLERLDVNLPNIKIVHIDAFLAEFTANFKPGTCRVYRSILRGFLRYLYDECKVLEKNLAPLVVGAPLFARARPPKFMRPKELQQLGLVLTSAIY